MEFFLGNTMEIQWKYNGNTMEIQWKYNGNTMEKPLLIAEFLLKAGVSTGYPISAEDLISNVFLLYFQHKKTCPSIVRAGFFELGLYSLIFQN